MTQRLGMLTLAIFLFFASPVSGHWEKTRWNMTEAEVRAAYPDVLPVNARMVKLEKPITYLGRTFQAVGFNFDEQGRLSGVIFAPAPADTTEFGAELTRLFGPPIRSMTVPGAGGLAHALIFSDAANGNEVLLGYPIPGSAAKPSFSLMRPQPAAPLP